jgi:hypothetical protein
MCVFDKSLKYVKLILNGFEKALKMTQNGFLEEKEKKKKTSPSHRFWPKGPAAAP